MTSLPPLHRIYDLLFFTAMSFVVVLCVLFISCSPSSADDALKITPGQDDADQIDLADWQYIKLETPATEMIAYIDQMDIYDGRIGILDEHGTRKFFLFDTSGRFILSIPITDGTFSCFDLTDDGIFLSDPLGSRLVQYDYQGAYVRSIRLAFYPNNFKVLSTDRFLVKSYEIQQGGNVYHIIDGEGGVVHSMFADRSPFQTITTLSNAFGTRDADGNIPFVHTARPDIYRVTSDGDIEKEVTFDFGDWLPTEDEMMMKPQDFVAEVILKRRRFSGFLYFDNSESWYSITWDYNKEDGKKDGRRNHLFMNKASRHIYNLEELDLRSSSHTIDAYFFPSASSGDRFYGAAKLEGIGRNDSPGDKSYGVFDNLDTLLHHSHHYHNPFLYSFVPQERD